MGRFFGPAFQTINNAGFFRGSASVTGGGKTWTTLTTNFEASPNEFFRIYWLNNHWIITTQGNSQITIIRSTDGIHWAQNTVLNSSLGNQTPGATFGAGVYAITGNELGLAPRLLTSPDLVTWTARTAHFTTADTLQDPVFGNGTFLLVSATTSAYATSPDGINWTQQSTYVPASWGQPLFDGTRFVAPVIGVADTPKLAISSDGINWTESSATLSIANPLYMGANGSTQYVVGEQSDNHADSVNGALTVSTPILIDGSNFSAGWLAFGTGSDWAGCTAVNGLVVSSPNGLVWGADTVSGDAQFIINMAWNGTEWIAVGATGAAQNIAITRGP